MREYADFVREFVTTVQAGKKAGKTLEEVVKAWATPAKYNGYPSANEARVRGRDGDLERDEIETPK
jgi:hypothetical protein